MMSPQAADVPSVLEFDEKKLVAENFLGVSGPAGLPAAVVGRLHAAMAAVLTDATVGKRLEDLAVAGKRMSSAEFSAFVQSQVTEWAPAVRASGAKLD